MEKELVVEKVLDYKKPEYEVEEDVYAYESNHCSGSCDMPTCALMG